MIVGWAVYALTIGALLAVAARVLEAGLHAIGGQTRWVWLVAQLATIGLPLLLVLGPADEPSAPLAVITSLPAIEFTAPADGDNRWLPSLRTMLVGGWVAASVVLVAIGGLSVWRLAQRRRKWQAREVDGVPVLVSRHTGPAVVGLRRCEIVIPEWALSLSAGERAYMLRHEEEHARAGDPRLLFAGGLLAALVPWNVFAWYQLRRLVIAIEVDCDRRVLRHGGDLVGYANLLLEFGQRLSHTMLPVTAFAEPRSILERRIRHMTARKPRRRIMRLSGAVAAAAAFVVIAAALPVPRQATLEALPLYEPDGGRPARTLVLPVPSAAATTMQTDTPPGADVLAGPVFTPFTTAPTLMNVADVAAALQAAYPAHLRNAGVGGTAQVWFLIDQSGAVVKVQLKSSTGHPELDDAALRVAETMQFNPARNRGVPVTVWVDMPIVFRTNEPIDSDFTRPATLSNTAEVASRLQRLYPPLLRDAGIGGEVFMLFDIDASGRVTRAEIGESSGHEALDEAALKLAREMRFYPAIRGNTPVASRLGLPITFRSQ